MKILLYYTNRTPDCFSVAKYACGMDFLDSISYNNEIRYLHYGDKIAKEIKNTEIFSKIKTYHITKEELHEAIGNEDEFEIFSNLNGSKDAIDRYIDLIKTKTEGYKPDIIICYTVWDSKLLRKMYPNSLVFLRECGIFSRSPFPDSFTYEPLNFYKDSFLNKFHCEIVNFKISKKQYNQINKLKKSLIKIIQRKNPIKNEIKKLRKKYKKILFFPSSILNCNTDLKFTDYATFYDSILSKVPKNYAVIITEHANGNFLSDKKNYDEFISKYPNMIFAQYYFKKQVPSYYFYPNVDAILSGISLSMPIQSLLFDCRNIEYCACHGDLIDGSIDNIKEALNSPKKDYNAAIYWLLTYYYVLGVSLRKKYFYSDYFNKLYKNYSKNGLTFDFYSKNDNIDIIINHIIDNVTEKMGYNKLFSIKRVYLDNCNKITIRLFGIKISFKTRRGSFE